MQDLFHLNSNEVIKIKVLLARLCEEAFAHDFIGLFAYHLKSIPCMFDSGG